MDKITHYIVSIFAFAIIYIMIRFLQNTKGFEHVLTALVAFILSKMVVKDIEEQDKQN
jgi:Na+/H+ antiporter NhaD/arsenite permease-like protein